MLLNDGIFWDDWLWVIALKEKNWSVIRDMGFERGAPLDTYFQWFFSGFHDIEFAHRFVAFLSILLAALLVYAICRQVGVLTRDESIWIALISMAYPAFQTQILLSTTNYLFYYMLFLGGVFLALKSQNRNFVLGYGLRFGALILFFLSFTLNSLLVFYFGFLLLLALFVRQLKALSVREMFTRFLPRHLDYILLPFLFWILKQGLFPVYGSYDTYNQFIFSPQLIRSSLVTFLDYGIFQQFYAPLQVFFTKRGVALLGLLSILWMIKDFRNSSFRHLTKSYGLLAYGFLLMSLAILPYIVVGRSPSLTGWGTRHSLLLALPVALIIVAVARILFHAPKGGFSVIGKILLTTLLLTFSFATISHYVGWQARWVKDRSMMVNLGQLNGAEEYSVYWIDDQFPLGGEANYDVYEWSSIFKLVWGGETRIGFHEPPSTTQKITDYKPIKGYNIDDFDPAGCQAILMIRQGASTHSEVGLVARYFYYRFLQPQSMQDFLVDITRVQVSAFASPLAVNCKQN